jgi:ABC-2 type transport system permease protein
VIAPAHVLTVFRREMAAYFNAAIAYIFIIVFMLLNGGLFMTQFFLIGLADMRPFFTVLPFILSVFLPAVTMRLWAEEKRGNTLELLLTFPMATHELVIGKYLASMVFYLAALAGTFPVPLMLGILGAPDWGTIAGGYLGAALLGSFFLSLGIFISGLCRDQIVAFILAMMVCFSLHLTGSEFIASSIDGWVPGLGSLLRQFIGSAGHFESFAKGVVDSRDLLYFVTGTVIFLVLNGFWFEGRMKPGAKKIFTAAVVVSTGIFLAGNWLLAGIPLGRFDLTQGKIYTVSDATKKILRGIKAPVTAKLYISPADKMPTGMKTLEQDVTDKLDEIRVASGGRFQYKVFHMEAANIVEGQKDGSESLESQLQRKGIQPFQVRAIESDEVNVRLVYSSLSLAYKEKPEEIIPRVVPDNLNELEYLLMARIYRMTLPEVPKIALVAPFQEQQVDPQMAALLQQLGGRVPEAHKEDLYELLPMALEYEGYQVSRIELSEKQPVPAGAKTLVVLEPHEFSERQRYELNRFVRGGGSLFLAVQNYNYHYQTTGRDVQIMPEPLSPSVNPLLKVWGLGVDEQILVDQQHDVINLSGGARIGPFEVTVPVKIPIQVLVTEKGMNPDVSITSRLSPIFYLWGTPLQLDKEKIKNQNLKVDTLLSSSSQSWSVPFVSGQLTPDSLAAGPDSKRGPFPLAVFAQGQFADAFEGKPAPFWSAAAESGEKAERAEEITPAPGKVILVGAATPFQKHLLRGGGHLNFFLNAVDALTLGEELVTIRSKQPVDRSVGRVSAAAKIGWRVFVMVLAPALVAAAGGFRMILRRRAKQQYMKTFALTQV